MSREQNINHVFLGLVLELNENRSVVRFGLNEYNNIEQEVAFLTRRIFVVVAIK